MKSHMGPILNQCCDNTVQHSSPKKPKEGRVREVVICGSCRTKLMVEFDCKAILGTPALVSAPIACVGIVKG